MEKKTSSVVDLAKANKLARILHFAVISILTICYVFQYKKNGFSIAQVIILILVMWVPIVLSAIAYKRKKDSELIKHYVGIGYGLFYLVICLFSDQQLVFAYAFPMIVAIGIFCDLKFSLTVGITALIVASVHAVICTARVGFTPASVAALEIEIAATLLIGLYTIISNKFIIDLTNKQVKDINTANEKTEEMLAEITEVANVLADQVSEVSDKLTVLSESSDETLTAMQEVQSGTGESANAVSSQLKMTENISEQIGTVTTASENIGNNVRAALDSIHEGQQNINRLMEQAKVSEEAANNAVDVVEELKQSTDKMESIVELISSVAGQTSLLALNASIEAARAGEAGRGFSVVATEISNLAGQTQTATEDIGKIISTITSEMASVSKAILTLVDNSKTQNEAAKVTAESFEKIVTNSNEIKNDSAQLTNIVGSLENSNREIVESIQTISAITEQVSAHSTTTCDITEKNMGIVSDVKEIVEEMTMNSSRLKHLEG